MTPRQQRRFSNFLANWHRIVQWVYFFALMVFFASSTPVTTRELPENSMIVVGYGGGAEGIPDHSRSGRIKLLDLRVRKNEYFRRLSIEIGARPLRTYSGVVYPAQCDAMGHFNVAHYVGAFDQAMWHAVHALGYDADWQFSRKEGWADVRHDVTFSRELKAGSLFYIESEVVDLGRTSITTAHFMRTMNGELCATDQVRSVYFDLEARRAIPLPYNIRATASEKIPGK